MCGEGHLFRAWVRMRPVCPRCGLRFKRVPGHWLGSWFLNICVGQAVVVLVLIVGVASTYPDSPMGVLALAAATAAVVVPVVFFPWSRTLWSAIDLAMRPLEFGDGVAPGYELEFEQLDATAGARATRRAPPSRRRAPRRRTRLRGERSRR